MSDTEPTSIPAVLTLKPIDCFPEQKSYALSPLRYILKMVKHYEAYRIRSIEDKKCSSMTQLFDAICDLHTGTWRTWI